MEIKFEDVLAEKKKLVWPEIQKYLKNPLSLSGSLAIPKKYSLVEKFHWQMVSEYPRRLGKYLRPTLLFLTAEAMGVPTKKAVLSAAAMQTSEDWILNHDDWEDDSLERRGKPALHRIYGPELAINAGDALHMIMWKMLWDNRAVLGEKKAAEIAHSFLLMHDDIIDQDPLRRNLPTIYVQYQKLHKERYKKGDPQHYGTCMAIDLGDAGIIIAQLVLAGTDFSSVIKEKVLQKFNQVLLETAFGQAIDVTYEHYPKVAEEDVMRVHHFKSANYTITGPLQYGALFAGASEGKVERIEKYGLPVGIAFQLRDDELGIFSKEDKLGKPVGSDIRENKNTLLHIKALEWATPKDRKFLEYAYGNPGLTKNEVRKVQQFTIKSGALSYSQKLSRKLVEKGKKFIPQITTNFELQDTLCKMADFMIERNS